MTKTIPAPVNPQHHRLPPGTPAHTFDAYRSHVLAVEAARAARVAS